MSRILIIKFGALGDVLRTTPILHVLDDDIDWIINPLSESLVPLRCDVISQEQARRRKYDLVLALDEDYRCAWISSIVKKSDLVGTYLGRDKKIKYTVSSREWFDMSLISRFEKVKADQIKFDNQRSYQEIMFGMIGRTFLDEPYILECKKTKTTEVKDDLGIEKTAGDRWPLKVWSGFDKLIRKIPVPSKVFEYQQKLSDYIRDISECRIILTGDTLALHIGLALNKKVIGLFTCTSPSEIFDYGCLTKIVSPKLKKAFYKTEYNEKLAGAIKIKDVEKAIYDLWSRNNAQEERRKKTQPERS